MDKHKSITTAGKKDVNGPMSPGRQFRRVVMSSYVKWVILQEKEKG